MKKGKGELFEHLKANGGLIVLNEDEPFLSELAKGAVNVLKYSDSSIVMTEEKVKADPDVFGDYCALRLTGANLYEVRTALVGGYNYRNVLVALQIAGHLGVSLDVAVKVLDGFGLEINRSQWVRHEDNYYIMDAYNANPTSMKNALMSFFNSTGERKKKVVILGDMLELGDASEGAHKEVLDLLTEEEMEMVLCIGPIFRSFAKEYPFHFFNEINEAKAFWLDMNLKGYKVLVKGSRAIALEQLIEPNPTI